MIKALLTVEDAQSVVRALKHLVNQAEGTGASAYAIDTLCRRDCAARFRRISQYVNDLLSTDDKVP